MRDIRLTLAQYKIDLARTELEDVARILEAIIEEKDSSVETVARRKIGDRVENER